MSFLFEARFRFRQEDVRSTSLRSGAFSVKMQKLTYAEIQKNRLTEAAAAASAHRLPVIAILENIRSLYNVGSIFRTSDGAHLEAIYTVGYTPHPDGTEHPRYKEIEKTALGATRTVPHKHFETISEAIASLKNDECRMMNDEKESNSSSSLILHPSPERLLRWK